MLPLAGQPVLRHVIARLRAAHRVDDIVVATSVDDDDDVIADACASWNVRCVRGPLDDVLTRFCIAIEATKATSVVRVPADKPFLDPDTVDLLVDTHLSTGADYTSNMGPGWPSDHPCPFGLELEVASAAALLRANTAACTKADREHVMPYLYRADHGFKVVHIAASNPFAPLKPRLNLDTPEDYEVISAAYDALLGSQTIISLSQLRAFFASHPELVEHNAEIPQRGFK
jgi:spore coat polysaccharide biosynthesis protein SpsF